MEDKVPSSPNKVQVVPEMQNKDRKAVGRDTLTSLSVHPLISCLCLGTRLGARGQEAHETGGCSLQGPGSGHRAGWRKILVFSLLTGKSET